MEKSEDYVRLGEMKKKILNEVDKALDRHDANTTKLWLKALREVNFQIRRLK